MRLPITTPLAWAYAAAAVAAVAVVRVGGDRWGWATLAAYGPRAVLLTPAIPLAILVARRWWRGRRWRMAAAATGMAVVVVLVGGMGLTVPRPSFGGPATVATVRILELNANGGDPEGAQPYDPDRLAELVRRTVPDVLVLVEWPDRAVPPGGPWDVRQSGDVVIASRSPIVGKAAVWRAGPLAEGRAVAAQLTVGGRLVWVAGLHLETPRRGFEPVLHRAADGWAQLDRSLARRRQVSADASAFLRRVMGGQVYQGFNGRAVGGAALGPADGAADGIVAGDFNLVDDGAIYRASWSGWTDSFARCGWGLGWTKFQDGWGVRIDHVLTGHRCRPRRCWVGPDVGSDHRPLIADVDLLP